MLIHTYTRETGETVEISLVEERNMLVMKRDGRAIICERRTRPHTGRSALKRALEYERQDQQSPNTEPTL